LKFAECGVGYHANQAGEKDVNPGYLSNSVVIGLARPDCDECYNEKFKCSNLVAIMQPTFNVGP
jgi:hypothetical protein